MIMRPGEQHALERRTARRPSPATVGRMISAMVRAMSSGRHHRRGRIGAHAAGVGARVAVADALVVLRRRQRQRVLAVARARRSSLPRRREIPRSPPRRRPRRTRPQKHASMAASASLALSRSTTPLPAASPSAFTTMGMRLLGEVRLRRRGVLEASVAPRSEYRTHGAGPW